MQKLIKYHSFQDTYLFMELCDKGELKSMLDSTELSELVR